LLAVFLFHYTIPHHPKPLISRHAPSATPTNEHARAVVVPLGAHECLALANRYAVDRVHNTTKQERVFVLYDEKECLSSESNRNIAELCQTKYEQVPQPMGNGFGDGVIIFIFYILTAAILWWFFKIIAGIFEGILMAPFGIGFWVPVDEMGTRAMRYPRLFFTVAAIKNTIIPLANAVMIYTVTFLFLYRFEGNYWLYVVASIIWSLIIVNINRFSPITTLFNSTGTLILLWIGWGWLSCVVTGAISIIANIAYSWGKVNMAYDVYDNQETADVENNNPPGA